MKHIIFGESHGPAIGVTLEGIPAGTVLNMDFIAAELARRAPGKSPLSTPRQEADRVEIIAGAFEGRATGTPLCAIIGNTDTRSADYEKTRFLPRPGHADYPGFLRYDGCADHRGGGHFSGRLTAPLVFAGAVAKLILEDMGVAVSAHISNIAGVQSPTEAEVESLILDARREGDSVGGAVRCTITGLPAGVGAPDFGENAEGIFAQHLFAVPAVKAIEFGAGKAFAAMRGSQANDSLYMERNAVKARTNHAGGINGGITNGMPLELEVTFRPTPSIAKEQDTVNLDTLTDAKLSIQGRHDPCVVPRAVVVVEAAAALAACQLLGI